MEGFHPPPYDDIPRNVSVLKYQKGSISYIWNDYDASVYHLVIVFQNGKKEVFCTHGVHVETDANCQSHPEWVKWRVLEDKLFR